MQHNLFTPRRAIVNFLELTQQTRGSDGGITEGGMSKGGMSEGGMSKGE